MLPQYICHTSQKYQVLAFDGQRIALPGHRHMLVILRELVRVSALCSGGYRNAKFLLCAPYARKKIL